MNETTPPPGTPSGGGSPNGFFAWIRGLGIVRSTDHWFAGVAGGIAAKAGIDPLIVRGVFVVLAVLGGPGILLYLAGWLLLPDWSGRIHLEEMLRGRASAGVTVAAVILGALLVLPLLFWIVPAMFAGLGGWGPAQWMPGWLAGVFGWLWWIAIIAGISWAVVWMVRYRGPQDGRPVGEQASEFAADTGRRAAQWGEQAGQRANEWGEQFGEKAEAWGRKVEEKSRDWEHRAQAHHEAHRLGAAHVVVTLALALLAAGIGAAWVLGRSASQDLLLTAALLAAVAVLSLSMIIAGIRGRDSGWIGFLAFCGVVALVFAPFTRVMPEQTRFVPFGNYSLESSAGDPDSAVVMIAGNTEIDLTELASGDAPRTIEVWKLFGNVTVELGGGHASEVRVNVLGGSIETDGRVGQSGMFVSRTIGDDSGGQATQVRVRTLFGNVYVEGVSATSDDAVRQYEKRIAEERERLKELESRLKELEKAQ